MSKKDEKKEKVIHTRISETLEQELKHRASGLGVSVSNLVRNVLLNTFGLVESVARDSANVARSVKGEPDSVGAEAVAMEDERPAPGTGQEIIGWQPTVLAINAVCTTCNALLPRGSDTAVALMSVVGAARPILCMKCLEEIRHHADPKQHESEGQ